jgi:hypothetical protein
MPQQFPTAPCEDNPGLWIGASKGYSCEEAVTSLVDASKPGCAHCGAVFPATQNEDPSGIRDSWIWRELRLKWTQKQGSQWECSDHQGKDDSRQETSTAPNPVVGPARKQRKQEQNDQPAFRSGKRPENLRSNEEYAIHAGSG